jgi:hypothetical protein
MAAMDTDEHPELTEEPIVENPIRRRIALPGGRASST